MSDRDPTPSPDGREQGGKTQPGLRRRTQCRACRGDRLRRFLELGPQPLANAFLRSPREFEGEALYPLDVYCCQDCWLVQLLDVIDAELLFSNYLYVSGTSDTVRAHHAELAGTLAKHQRLASGDLVVEVASNDGSLLLRFQEIGVRTLGIEPAGNIAELARGRGVETLGSFFDSAVARGVRQKHGAARAVVANNVLAHVDDTVDFLRGCRELVDSGGLVSLEVPYLGDLLDRVEYDTIYHEHLCYFSVSALRRLCDEAGLCIVRIEHHALHGGTLRLFAVREAAGRSHAKDVLDRIARERDAGMTDFARYQRFAAAVRSQREALRALLERLRGEGARLAAYGAPAKGNTLLNYCGIDTGLLEFTVDKSPLKVGLYTPGAHLPVRPVAALAQQRPDYAVILPWNFAEEVTRQQSEYLDMGGRFVLPVPEPRIL